MSMDSPAWYEGSLSIHSFKALNAPRTALRAGRYFGAVPSTKLARNRAEDCARLFYGTTETNVHELL